MTVQNDSDRDLRISWWLEVGMTRPLQVHYIGPFRTKAEADLAREAALGDLRQSGHSILFAQSRFCQPRKLQILENELTIADFKRCPSVLFEAMVIR